MEYLLGDICLVDPLRDNIAASMTRFANNVERAASGDIVEQRIKIDVTRYTELHGAFNSKRLPLCEITLRCYYDTMDFKDIYLSAAFSGDKIISNLVRVNSYADSIIIKARVLDEFTSTLRFIEDLHLNHSVTTASSEPYVIPDAYGDW